MSEKEMKQPDTSEFIRGQQDCRDGKPHQDGQGEAYDMGYNFEYQYEQIMSERCQ